MRERRYDDNEVAQILSQAVARQSGNIDTASVNGMTLQELQRVAGEVGIDPGEIERVALDLDSKRQIHTAPRSNSALFEQSVAGEISEETWEQLVTVMQAYAGSAGKTEVNEPKREWRGGSDVESVMLSATTRKGRTQLKLLGDVSGVSTLTATFGFVFGLFASMVPMIVVTKAHLTVNPLFTAMIVLLIIASTIVATTGIIRRNRARFDKRMNGLMDRLVASSSAADEAANPLRTTLESARELDATATTPDQKLSS